MINVNKLKGKIVENGMSVAGLAERMGIDRATLYRKISNDGENMTISEAEKISNILNLTMEEVNSIFFSRFVA